MFGRDYGRHLAGEGFSTADAILAATDCAARYDPAANYQDPTSADKRGFPDVDQSGTVNCYGLPLYYLSDVGAIVPSTSGSGIEVPDVSAASLLEDLPDDSLCFTPRQYDDLLAVSLKRLAADATYDASWDGLNHRERKELTTAISRLGAISTLRTLGTLLHGSLSTARSELVFSYGTEDHQMQCLPWFKDPRMRPHTMHDVITGEFLTMAEEYGVPDVRDSCMPYPNTMSGLIVRGPNRRRTLITADHCPTALSDGHRVALQKLVDRIPGIACHVPDAKLLVLPSKKSSD